MRADSIAEMLALDIFGAAATRVAQKQEIQYFPQLSSFIPFFYFLSTETSYLQRWQFCNISSLKLILF